MVQFVALDLGVGRVELGLRDEERVMLRLDFGNVRRHPSEIERDAVVEGDRNERTPLLSYVQPEDVRPEFGGFPIIAATDNGVIELY
ncbi:hypothetical protein GCM10011610_09860 [Nocardia rhizosphaerihabitans]|uniref:Uncharacterized protein n=1 Tax=Nocardia rhizosphaerihabitans TaxID=1691570 RepID=A0ABQ2K5B6_9NOCA|nr:hypothetical protein GCM10011610_09860 [Nocardia rhizosphaerihabitans]